MICWPAPTCTIPSPWAVSYSPELYFHSINYFPCIPDCKDQETDATGAATSVWLCWQPLATMLRDKYHGSLLLMEVRSHPPIPHSESEPVLANSCFVPPWFLWISKGNLTPCQRVFCSLQAPPSMHCAHRGIWLQILHPQHSSNVFPEQRPPKKKNLTTYLKKERRNAGNEPTNIKTQEAAF